MFSTTNTSGKHMICDIRNIHNQVLLNTSELLINLLDTLCDKYNFTILDRSIHTFPVQGFSAIYLLTESHISIHTFPERNYVAIDIYTCRNYPNNDVYNQIYHFLIHKFQADKENPTIIDRQF